MYDYKMPEEVKKEFTKNRMTYFLEELIDTFDIADQITYFDHIAYLESTQGWHEAVKRMCINYGLEDILHYYYNLAWYDSDIFDSEFSRLLLEHGLIEEGEIEQDC